MGFGVDPRWLLAAGGSAAVMASRWGRAGSWSPTRVSGCRWRATRWSDRRVLRLLACPRSGLIRSRGVGILACRSGEVRGCRWDEIDLEAATWTVPPSRTKTAVEHRVPLSTCAVAVLGAARRLSGRGGLVFPSTSNKMLSDSTMSKLMRELDLGGTPHGMRAAFRSWCSDTAQPRDLAEQALGHAERGVEAAYARSDMLERRRDLMQQWADYLVAPTPCDISLSEGSAWNSGPAAESAAAATQPLAAHGPSHSRSSVGQFHRAPRRVAAKNSSGHHQRRPSKARLLLFGPFAWAMSSISSPAAGPTQAKAA